jgi:hypothetical protein
VKFIAAEQQTARKNWHRRQQREQRREETVFGISLFSPVQRYDSSNVLRIYAPRRSPPTAINPIRRTANFIFLGVEKAEKD